MVLIRKPFFTGFDITKISPSARHLSCLALKKNPFTDLYLSLYLNKIWKTNSYYIFFYICSILMTMELAFKKSYPLTQQSMSNFGLVGQPQKTSLFTTLRNMSTPSMTTSWSTEFVGLTNGLITILPLMVMDRQHCQTWPHYFSGTICITIGGRLLEHTKSMQLVRFIE